MRLEPRVRIWLRDHTSVADAALAALLLPVLLLVRDPDQPLGSDRAPVVTAVLVILICAALVVRRRWPVPVLAVTTVGGVAVALIGGRTLVVTATMIALYTVAIRSDRRTTVVAWVSTAAALTAAGLIQSRGVGHGLEALAFVGWTGMAAAVGDALRNRRAYVAAVEERAVRAEQSREEEAHRRVVEERLRIARELHDVVAHRIAVVNVQAGVASHLLRSQPDAAEEALRHVREAGRAVLDEVADILSVLRESDDSTAPTAPAPSLAQLDELIASFSSAGLEVDWSLRGRPVDVGSAVGLVAYRLLQEALTNAHKHGTGTAHVLVAYGPSTVTLSVDNPLRRPMHVTPGAVSHTGGTGGTGVTGGTGGTDGTDGAGHGLLGMRERAAAVGGVLKASPEGDGRFHVEALLPVPSSFAA